MTIRGTGRNPTHHIAFSDGETKVGFVLTNPGGVRDETVFRRFPFADPSQPYTTETQTDWSGGFGNDNFEDNRATFWKSEGVDTLHSTGLVLGPNYYYARGVRAADFLWPTNKFHWRRLNGDSRYRAQRFIPGENYPAVYVKTYLRRHGTPPNITLKVCANSGSNTPGSQLASATITASQASSLGDCTLIKVAISEVSLQGGTVYWIVWDGGPVQSNKDWWEVGCDPDNSDGMRSANGTDWFVPSGNEGYFFRIANADLSYVPHFYDYKGQLYVAMEYDAKDTTSTKILMNGWRGACDSNSGDKGKLKDATQDWSNNVATGCIARIVAGNATAELDDSRKVLSGGAGFVTVDKDWQIAHTTGCDYVLLGSDRWFEVSKPDYFLGSQVVDAVVAKGSVYFCRGTKGMVIHRQYNNNGVWTSTIDTDSWRKTGVLAHHVNVMVDPVSGPVLWFGSNLIAYGRYRPYVFRAIPTEWGDIGYNRVSIEKFETEWTTAASTVESIYKAPPVNQQGFRVKVGVVQAINTTPTAGGSGYQVDDILTIDETGSGKNATVKVTAIGGGGAVTTLELQAGGWDYTVGAGKATTGGNGTGCTVEVATIQSFTTGLIAYKNLTDTVDVRYANRMKFWVQTTKPNVLNAGDASLVLDDSQFAASPIVTITIPKIVPDVWYNLDIEYDASEIQGADAIQSIGLQINTQKPKTFEIHLIQEIFAINKFDSIEVGEDGDNINGLEVWGDPESLWVLTETGIGEIRNNTFLPAPLRELKKTRHPNTGKGHTVNDVYLMFTWRGKLQRYFRQNLENLGPNWPKGFGNINGMITDAVTYAGRVYAAVDGGTDRPSQVICFKGNAYHEIYTSYTGERIRKLYIQNIPGLSDRLWVGVGGDLIYIPLTDNAIDLPYGTDYRYRNEGYLECSWVHTDRRDLDKLYKSVILFVDNMTKAGSQPNHFVDVMHILDEDTGEYLFVGTAEHGPHIELDLDSGKPPASIRGHRLRLRLRLRTRDMAITPTLRRTTLKIYRIPEVKFSYTFITKLSTLSINLLGDEESVIGEFKTVKAALDKLDTWAKTLTPLITESDISAANGKVVVLEPLPAQLVSLVPDESIEEMTVQVTANDV